MNLDLSGKIALVSGSTAGIGLATATKLAQLNAHVYVTGRTQKRVDDAIAKIKSVHSNAKVDGVACDLAKESDTKKLFEIIPKVDVLVNNLGIYEFKAFEDTTDEDWRRYFDVNVVNGVRLCRFYFPKMKETNWGRIVFVSSDSGVNTTPEMIHYSVTKTAQLAVARGLAELSKGTNVTVNSVIVGVTDTEGLHSLITGQSVSKEMNKGEDQWKKEWLDTALVQRPLSPEEIANMICYLCSPASSATNGAACRAEGGLIHTIL